MNNIYNFLVQIYNFIMNIKDPPVLHTHNTVDNLKALMLARSSAYTSYYPNASDPHRKISSYIGKLDDTTATLVSQLLFTESNKRNLDVAFTAAASFQETRWYPGTINRNLAEHNGVESFQNSDWGFAQNSGNQIPNLPGMRGLTQDQMIKKALDPNWSIPQFCNIMNDLYYYSFNLIYYVDNLLPIIKALPNWCVQSDISSSAVDGKDEVAMWYATGCYNRGKTGISNVIKQGGYNIDHLGNKIEYVHSFKVIGWYREFLSKL